MVRASGDSKGALCSGGNHVPAQQLKRRILGKLLQQRVRSICWTHISAVIRMQRRGAVCSVAAVNSDKEY